VTMAPLQARRLTRIDVPGIALTAEGAPARGIEVAAALLGENGRAYRAFPVKSDDEGHFRLRLWQGERYRILVGPSFNPDAELEIIASDEPITLRLRAR